MYFAYTAALVSGGVDCEHVVSLVTVLLQVQGLAALGVTLERGQRSRGQHRERGRGGREGRGREEGRVGG